MAWRGGSSAVDELRGYWRRWTGVVALFAKRRRARKWVSNEAYRQLYDDLLACCRELASMVDGEEREFFRGLEHLATPWVSLASLQNTHRDVLYDLLCQCRKLDREMGGLGLGLPEVRLPGRLLFYGSGAACLLLILRDALPVVLSLLDGGQPWANLLRSCLVPSASTQSLLLPAVVVVCVSSYMISRTARH